ncbi:serine hydrolase [Oceanobacillus alkalisoli]|uniref:serine hydrolase n=1 Tax=Oceanobacillus alkalisoli TaxID=2925113 RepID=UPI001F11A897|nr:serine hydrolase [Oceanobacillus alkalisoli]MCF3944778.1 class A beta-lactamase-related serine hydrolase [Oceanobacillus alkalisoli]
MNIWAWIGLSGIVVFALLAFLRKEYRTKEKIREAFITIAIVLAIIITVLLFNVDYILAFLLGVIAYILLDRKTYTKKRLIIYGGIIIVIGAAFFVIFRDNPDYVLNHLQDNRETTSLYVVKNGEEVIAYQSDIVRPLASTVKIMIALEYAMQVEAGALDKTQPVPLDELSRFFYEGTDGNAHETWLESIHAAGKVKDAQVPLHEVAKGMITYSSNANTDYLLHLLDISAINKRIESVGLTQHEPIYPLVSPLLFPEYIADDSMDKEDIIRELEAIPMERYRELAVNLSKQLKEGTIDINDHSFDLPLEVQKVWSDRLTRASAKDYGQLLTIISNDELPAEAAAIMRDLMEWPMEINEANQDYYTHIGSKGGSTAFILNDALYAEDLEGDRIEIVLFTDDLNLWQSLMLQNNINSFEVNLIGDEAYRLKVKQTLEEQP